MLSLTITGLLGIIPKLMALKRGWFKHARKDFRRFASLGTKDLAPPYSAMGCRMSKHAFLSHFSPYFLLFGRHPIPPSSIIVQTNQVVDLDSPATWARVIAEKGCSIQEGYAYGHGELVHCTTSRHLKVCTHTRWQLQT
jgi:hypothetical protein